MGDGHRRQRLRKAGRPVPQSGVHRPADPGKRARGTSKMVSRSKQASNHQQQKIHNARMTAARKDARRRLLCAFRHERKLQRGSCNQPARAGWQGGQVREGGPGPGGARHDARCHPSIGRNRQHLAQVGAPRQAPPAPATQPPRSPSTRI